MQNQENLLEIIPLWVLLAPWVLFGALFCTGFGILLGWIVYRFVGTFVSLLWGFVVGFGLVVDAWAWKWLFASKAIIPKVFVTRGDLRIGGDDGVGVYLSCTLPDGSEAHVYFPEGTLSQGSAVRMLSSIPVKESSILGSTIHSAGKQPRGVVYFTSGDRVVGHGFRLTTRQGDFLVTAAHVLQEIKRLNGVRVNANGVSVDFPRDAPLHTYSGPDCHDQAYLIVRASLWSRLGVKALKPRAVKPRTSVTVYAMYAGEWKMAIGTVEPNVGKAFVLKHLCSTHPSFSGTPIVDGDTVLGIHTEGHHHENAGVALLLAGIMETDDPIRCWHQRADPLDEDDDYCDEDNILLNGKYIRLQHRGPSYHVVDVDEYVWSRNRGWADELDELDAEYFSRPPFESAFPKAPLPPLREGVALQKNSGHMNGKNPSSSSTPAPVFGALESLHFEESPGVQIPGLPKKLSEQSQSSEATNGRRGQRKRRRARSSTKQAATSASPGQ